VTAQAYKWWGQQTVKCAECLDDIRLKVMGRPPRYCSHACRQKAWRKRVRALAESRAARAEQITRA